MTLSKLPVGCCCGNTVVNHLMYAVDIVLFAPSAKGLQRITDVSYTYGCDNDIIFNSAKSHLMFFDTLKYGHMKDIMLGQNALSVIKSYTYLGHIITDNICDEPDIYTTIGDARARARVCVCVCKIGPISARTLSFLHQTSRTFFSHSNFPIPYLWTAFCVPLSFVFLRKTII